MSNLELTKVYSLSEEKIPSVLIYIQCLATEIYSISISELVMQWTKLTGWKVKDSFYHQTDV